MHILIFVLTIVLAVISVFVIVKNDRLTKLFFWNLLLYFLVNLTQIISLKIFESKFKGLNQKKPEEWRRSQSLFGQPVVKEEDKKTEKKKEDGKEQEKKPEDKKEDHVKLHIGEKKEDKELAAEINRLKTINDDQKIALNEFEDQNSKNTKEVKEDHKEEVKEDKEGKEDHSKGKDH